LGARARLWLKRSRASYHQTFKGEDPGRNDASWGRRDSSQPAVNLPSVGPQEAARPTITFYLNQTKKGKKCQRKGRFGSLMICSAGRCFVGEKGLRLQELYKCATERRSEDGKKKKIESNLTQPFNQINKTTREQSGVPKWERRRGGKEDYLLVNSSERECPPRATRPSPATTTNRRGKLVIRRLSFWLWLPWGANIGLIGGTVKTLDSYW